MKVFRFIATLMKLINPSAAFRIVSIQILFKRNTVFPISDKIDSPDKIRNDCLFHAKTTDETYFLVCYLERYNTPYWTVIKRTRYPPTQALPYNARWQWKRVVSIETIGCIPLINAIVGQFSHNALLRSFRTRKDFQILANLERITGIQDGNWISFWQSAQLQRFLYRWIIASSVFESDVLLMN